MKSNLTWIVIIAVLTASCAHSRREREAASAAFLPPEPPAFLNGPLGLVLANLDGFSSHVVMETGVAPQPPEIVSGELLGCGNLLEFTLNARRSPDKGARAAGISFVWDVKENRGYMLSEALQAYAPITFSLRYTNVSAVPGSSGSERINGHLCSRELVTVTSSEGATGLFQVWRAGDLKDFPVRIATATNAVPRTVSFSKIRLEKPPDELFRPPEAFTKYDNANALMSELLMRQQNLRRPKASGLGENEPPPVQEQRPTH